LVAAGDEPLPLEDASAWLEQAHTQVENVFEGCLTERARALFGGAEDASPAQ